LKRKRREHETLSDQRIVDAALALIRRAGADRFSMRSLAKELGVTPMAVYYYVGNKDSLFERVADAVLARVPRPQPSGHNWREELKATAVAGFKLLSEYPGLSAQIVKRPPTKQTEELAKYGIAVLMAAGFDPAVAARATVVCQTFMFGMIGLQAQLERAQKRKRKASPSEAWLETVDAQGLVEFGLDTLSSGLRESLGTVRKTRRLVSKA
jgi:AcrR family transcriptional regulator